MAAYQHVLLFGLLGFGTIALAFIVTSFVLLGRAAQKSPEHKDAYVLWRKIVVGVGVLLLAVLIGVFVWIQSSLRVTSKTSSRTVVQHVKL